MQQFAMDRNFFRVILGGVVGSTLEWYDFMVYVYLAPIMSILFFPHRNAYTSLMLTYFVFAVGYLARPIGGIFFGHYGDRIGRRKTLILSMMLMSLSTVLVGFLPTYYTAGLWAPILLIFLRIAQGLATAGEIIGAMTFAFESSPPRYRGMISTCVWVAHSSGIIFASLLVFYISKKLSMAEMYAWGWRIPFYFGVITAIAGFYIRSGTRESIYFTAMVKRGEVLQFPSLSVLRQYKKRLGTILFIFAPFAANYYICFVFLPIYASEFFGHSLSQALWVNSMTMILLFILTPIAACLSDRMGRKPFLLFALLANVLLAVVLFNLIATGTLFNFFIAQGAFAVIQSVYVGAVLSAALEAVPTRVRFSTVAIGYNLAYAIFGGTAPLIVTYMIHRNKTLIAPAFYMILVGLIALLFVLKMKETYKDVVL